MSSSWERKWKNVASGFLLVLLLIGPAGLAYSGRVSVGVLLLASIFAVFFLLRWDQLESLQLGPLAATIRERIWEAERLIDQLRSLGRTVAEPAVLQLALGQTTFRHAVFGLPRRNSWAPSSTPSASSNSRRRRSIRSAARGAKNWGGSTWSNSCSLPAGQVCPKT